MATTKLIKKVLKQSTPAQLIKIRALLKKIMVYMDILPGIGAIN